MAIQAWKAMKNRRKWSFFYLYKRYWRMYNRISPNYEIDKIKTSPLRHLIPYFHRFNKSMSQSFDLAPDQSKKPAPSDEAKRLGREVKHVPEHDFSLSGNVRTLDDLNVACILDDFTFTTFSKICHIKQVTSSNWSKEMEEMRPHLLFVEATWHGIDDSWRRKVSIISDELVQLLRWCKENDVPTIFWNKDDPPHYATFINTAALFDFVFTTDVDLVGDYKKALADPRVFLLPFWAEPSLHNPMETYDRVQGFCFAGTYYVKYEERGRDFRTFVRSLSPLGPFDIYDRNEYAGNPNYSYPEEYRPFIRGSLPYDQIDRAYKGYLFGLNMNSIKQSQMMCARRTYELLASNTLVLSNYTRAMKNIFGDLILATDNGEYLEERVDLMLKDEDLRDRFRLAGLRKVLTEHTTEHRLNYLLEKVFGSAPGQYLPDILVLAHCESITALDKLARCYGGQRVTSKSILLICGSEELAIEAGEKGIRAISMSEAEGLSTNDLDLGDYVAFLSDSDAYGDNYLLDLVLTTKYLEADGIGKGTHHSRSSGGLELVHPGNEYRTMDALSLRSGMFKSALFRDIKLMDLISRIEDGVQEGRCFSVDRFNYCKDSDVLDENIDDLADLDEGMAAKSILRFAETLGPGESRFMPRSDVVLIAPHYPSYDNVYRYIFVHRRVQSYKAHGLLVDVVRSNRGLPRGYTEFNGVDILTPGPADLRRMVDDPACKVILVHFLNEEIWSMLRTLPDDKRIVVWVHGAEIQPWNRRDFNYETKMELKKAKQDSEQRLHFWRTLFSNVPENLHFVFVSSYFYEEVMEDVGVPLQEGNFSIIHNYVDTHAFRYKERGPEMRCKILSVRPFYSRKYGNDLTVSAILELSKRPFFDELQFHIVGEGRLFEETVAPLRGFANVKLDNRSLSEREYREIFDDHGVFLCPTRWDSQGVSRDEAMACGLVAITNKVAAIPEFVDEECCMLVPPEDHVAMADAVERLYRDSQLYQRLSTAGAERVERTSGLEQTIQKEMDLIGGKVKSVLR